MQTTVSRAAAALLLALSAALSFAAQPNEEASPAAASALAWLPDTVGLHLGSKHDAVGPRFPESFGWNNDNYGVFALWPIHRPRVAGVQATGQLALGYVAENSLWQPSVYTAYHLRSEAASTALGAVSVGVSAGVFWVGYERAVNPGVNHTGPVPRGYSVKPRCNERDGCINTLVKPTPAPLLSAGIFWQPSKTHPLTVGIQRLPNSGYTGSGAWTFTSEWRFKP